MTRSAFAALIRITAVSLALAAAPACTPIIVGAAAAGGAQAVTGRNGFYWLDKAFGRSCADVSYFDQPVRCINDRG